MVEAKFSSMGGSFTGIEEFKDKFKGKKAVICCSGTSLKSYDDSAVPENWIRIAVNEGIRRIKDTADFWVLSDKAIVVEYGDLCEEHTTVLAMHQASKYIHKRCKSPDIYTTNSMPMPPKEYDNGYEFFSRGTVLIGAVEMARYMGIKEFYVFGLDCFRTKDTYYYDNRIPEHGTERNVQGAKQEGGLFITSRLRRMIHVLDDVKSSGLWKGISIHCVDSPKSMQRAIPKLTMEEFSKKTSASPTLVKRGIEDLAKMTSENMEEADG